MLPCEHKASVVEQIQPTIELLKNLDELHPDILRQHMIAPVDYNGSLVFRSAVESIRGSFVASATRQREDYVAQVLSQLQRQALIENYEQFSSRERFDFVVTVTRQDNLSYFVALEVKGGEGNSINISERPPMAHEFGVWCHLDGAIRNQPAHGAHSVVNRITNDMVRRQKLVDVVFVKDSLCGSNLRQCPKYRGDVPNSLIAPDILLLPQRIPSPADPRPPVNTLETLRMPRLILEAFGVRASDQEQHVWAVDVSIQEKDDGRLFRLVEIIHQGEIVDRSQSRSWQP